MAGNTPYDLVRNAINGDDTTDHQWISGIAASPQLIGDHDDVIPSQNILIGEKDAPQLGPNPPAAETTQRIPVQLEGAPAH